VAKPGESNIDELLKRLSQVKPLPQRSAPFRTQQAAAGSQLRDLSRNTFASTPDLRQSILDIQQGGSAATGPKGLLASVLNSAPAKAVFGGLTVVDTPRRAIISSIKEVADALDNNPATKFSMGDWGKQISDPTFGWGRVRPGKGWGARIEGFIGDVLLDPLTYASFGGSIPLKGARAAQAATLLGEGATRTLFRQSVSVTGREGRFALARAARKLGAGDELVRNVAARGKSALTPELASKLGVRRNGLYLFGSRVRVKGSTRIGNWMEQGLVGARLGIMKTNMGKKLSYLYTPRGTKAMGDLSTWRADVASGRLSPKRVRTIMSALNGAEDARIAGGVAYADELVRVTELLDDAELKAVAGDLHRFIENPSAAVLSPGQTLSVQKVENYLDAVANRIQALMAEIEPGWTFNKRKGYIPHILTQKARNAIEAEADTPWAQLLERYLSVDVLDMKNNLQQRHIVAGMKDFLGSGEELVDGSIEGINAMFRKVTGKNFDLFETDINKILYGYLDTVRSAAEVNAIMKNLMDDDFVRVLKETGQIDEDFMKALKTSIDNKLDKVGSNNEKLSEVAKKMRSTLQEQIGARGNVTKRLLDQERALVGKIDELGAAATEQSQVVDNFAANIGPLIEQSETIAAAQLATLEELTKLTADGNALTALVKEQVLAFQKQIADLRTQLDTARAGDWQAKLGERLAGNFFETVDDELLAIEKRLASNQKLLQVAQEFGNSFGPELQRIFKSFYADAFDDTEVVDLGVRFSSADVKGFLETDQVFNNVIDTVTNPFSTNYLAGPGGEAEGVKGIADAWVKEVVTTPGTPEAELLNSIPDLGARGSKAQRVSMGAKRDDARSMTLVEARAAVVRGSLLGDNTEEVADAFYFLTLRELRASELAATDAVARKAARSSFANELLKGTSERAKAWRAARDAVIDLQKGKQQFDILASERVQQGTTTIVGKTIYLSEDGQNFIPNLERELVELETMPTDSVMRQQYASLVSNLDKIIGSGEVTIEEIGRLRKGIMQFFDLATIGPESAAAERNLQSLDEFLSTMVDENLNINPAAAGDVKNVLESFVAKYLITDDAKMKIVMKRAELQEALNNPELAQADYISQKVAVAEQTVAKTTREVGDVLTNYSIYHNARMAVDYIHRLIPDGIEISDSLLRFAFAGSAKQHEQYARTLLDNHHWVSSHWATIEAERAGVPFSQQAVWLKSRLTQKLKPKPGSTEVELVPLSVDELNALSQVMGDLTLVSRNVPRDIQSFRPNQPQWSSHVKRVLDLTDKGWDNSMTPEIAAAVGGEVKTGARAAVETGAGTRGALPRPNDYGKLSEKTSRDMQGAFKIQSEVNNKISNMRKISPEKLIEKIKIGRQAGLIPDAEANRLIEATLALETELKAQWKSFAKNIKKETGYSVSELNKIKRSLKNVRGDTYGMAYLWSQATKLTADGSTRNYRAIDDFFAYLRGGQDVLVSRGGRGSVSGVEETMTLPSYVARGEDGKLVSGGERFATFEAPRSGRGGKPATGADVRTEAQRRISDVYAEARKVRKRSLERMAYIATQLGVDEDPSVVKILENMVSAEDRLRVLKLQAQARKGKAVKGEELEGLIEQEKLIVKQLNAEFNDAINASVSGVTRGSRSPDITKHISFGESHLGKMRDSLTRKIGSFQELVFSPEAGLANVDSLRFGLDDLDTGKMALYRVRYLRGLAEDYKNALDAHAAAAAARAKVKPGSRATAAERADFDLFQEAYAGDERKFGQLIRWIDSAQEAIAAGEDLPPRPKGIVVPRRVFDNLARLRRTQNEIAVLTQSVEYTAAREASDFNDFLKELSYLNINPDYHSSVSQVKYRYDVSAERALRRQLSIFAGGLSPDKNGRVPQMTVYKMEELAFDNSLMTRFAKGDSTLDDLGVIVRTENGYEEIIDSKRAVVDYVRALRKQKFSYEVTEHVDSEGRRLVTYTDLNGPIGERSRYTYFVDDQTNTSLNGDFSRDSFAAGAGRDPEYLGGTATGDSRRVLDIPVYAHYGAQQIQPINAPPNVIRHYSALASGAQTTVVRHTDMLSDTVARSLIVGGNAEALAKTKNAVEANDFAHLIDPSKTYVFYDVPSKGHRIVERLDRAGLPVQDKFAVDSLNPDVIFQGLSNDILEPAFALEQNIQMTRTKRLLGSLEKLYARQKDLQEKIDAARLDMKARQVFLVELDDVKTDIDFLTKELNSGLPKQRNASRAAAWNLWDKFKQPHVVGFLLGKSFSTADEAEAFALDAFKAYLKKLHEYKVSTKLETGEMVDFFPFATDVGVSEKRRGNLAKNWNGSEDKSVIDRYNGLNRTVNAVHKDLNVVRNGGEAADLAARYTSVLEQLRVAERKLALAKENVASEFYRTAEDASVGVARKNRDDARNALNQAKQARKAAEVEVRRASQTFVPEQAVSRAEFELGRMVEMGLPPQQLQAKQMQISILQQQRIEADTRRTQLIAKAEEKLRVADADIAKKESALRDADIELRRASEADTARVRSATAQLEQDALDPDKAMTPEKFDKFVEDEIKRIREGRVPEVSVSVSMENYEDIIAETGRLTQRQEVLSSLRPGLQSRYESARKLSDVAEKRYKALQVELDKANRSLAKIEQAEAKGGSLPFAGKSYPVEYAAAKAQQKDKLKQVVAAQKRLDELNSQMVRVTAEVNAVRSAGAEVATLQLKRDEAVNRLSLLRSALDVLGREPNGRPSWVRNVVAKDWDVEFDDVKSEIDAVFKALRSLPADVQGKDVDRVYAVWTKYLEARAAVLLSKDDWAQAVQLEKLGAAGVLNSDNMVWSRVLDEGFVELEGRVRGSQGFQNLQVRPEALEILTNLGRVRDGAFVRQMRRFMGPYTNFFKAWALATPGFHVRNSITNGYMLIAAGGNPVYLSEGMQEFNALRKFMMQNKPVGEYLNTIGDIAKRKRVSDAYKAMIGSGVGQSQEFLFDTAGKATNNPITRQSRRAGVWIEGHSRFMLAYDGLMQGLDVPAATARVRKFLFDYEDMSKLDSYMRQIIPFWTWTSRNVPLTITNIYMNPRPYQIYQSFKRNVQDEEKTKSLPLYMREAGGFALPGTNLAASPELGFNRLQADVSMMSDPLRVAANVNPLLRVPVETALAGKSFFRNREFQKTPIPVEGPVGTLASLLGTPVGMGQSVGGQRYVDEKLLYGLSNMIPTLNQVERFVPSQEYYKQRGSMNPWLGILGSPVKEVTPSMLTGEQKRRMAEIRKLLESQPKPQGG